MYQFVVIFISVILLGYLLERFLILLFGFRIFRLLTAPGILVHEAAHALTAILFGAKIKSFQVFKASGGEVSYTKPVFPLISQPVISTAPILACSVVLYLVGICLGFSFKDFHLQFSFADLVADLAAFFQTFGFNWKTIIFLYLVLSLTSAMAPSRKDLINATWGIVFLLIVFFLVYYFYSASNLVFLKMSYFYSIGLYMIILAFLITLVVWLIKLGVMKVLRL